MGKIIEQKRGQLTYRIKEKSLELLGYQIDQTELRLLPYIQFVMVNEQLIDVAKINAEERKILQKWRDKELIEGGATGISITKKFWNILTELIFLGYVDLT